MGKSAILNLKEFIRDYLSFSYKERIGVLTLCILILLVILLPEFFPKKAHAKPDFTDSNWAYTVNSAQANASFENDESGYGDERMAFYQYDRNTNLRNTHYTGELFYFNPNTLDPAGWKKLGLHEKTIKTIQNYLNKGGRFYKSTDLKKIYGLNPKFYERIESYIRIDNTNDKPEKAVYEKDVLKPAGTQYAKNNYAITEINTADTTAFKSLPGIGNVLANRIVNFREKLGGFYAVSQIGETYGLPDSTFQKIKQYLTVDEHAVKKININTATLDELKSHPYIKFSLANPIIAYRNQHGLFSRTEDLKKIMAITEEVYKKISNYLTVN